MLLRQVLGGELLLLLYGDSGQAAARVSRALLGELLDLGMHGREDLRTRGGVVARQLDRRARLERQRQPHAPILEPAEADDVLVAVHLERCAAPSGIRELEPLERNPQLALLRCGGQVGLAHSEPRRRVFFLRGRCVGRRGVARSVARSWLLLAECRLRAH